MSAFQYKNKKGEDGSLLAMIPKICFDPERDYKFSKIFDNFSRSFIFHLTNLSYCVIIIVYIISL